jgi:hypothetical protein
MNLFCKDFRNGIMIGQARKRGVLDKSSYHEIGIGNELLLQKGRSSLYRNNGVFL